MRRNSSRTQLAAVSAALAAVLLIAGGLLLWGSAYVHNTVQGQLAAQQVTFPAAAAFAHPKAGSEITPNMIPSVSQYAGQQLLTGQQAEANNTQLSGLVATVFKGETLRSMLLNAYGWWKVSQITYIAALVSFGLGTVAAFVAGFAFVTGRRTKAVAEVLPSTGPGAQVKVA
jgi:hypothetical protein